MAGLLDNIFATSTDDPRYAANMALFGNMVKGDFGGGLLAASQAGAQARQAQQEQVYRAMQMQAMQQKAAQEQAEIQRKAEFDRMFLGGGAPAGVPAGGGIPTPGGASGGAPAGVMPGAMPQQQGAPGGMSAQQISQQYGIPLEAVITDYKFNGGKKIAELIDARSKPNWVNINGNLVNTNAPGFQGGFQPGVNVSNDGRATMWQPDGKGGLVVGAPTGAMDTYRAYQNIGEQTKANYDPITVTPAGQPPQMTTRGALANNPQVQGRMIPPAQQAAMDRDRGAILQQELVKAQQQLQTALRSGDQSAAARAQGDIAAISREIGGRTASVGMPLQSEEDKLRGQKGVEGDAKANEARVKDVNTAKKFLSIADQAEQVLKSGPTASGAGSLVDKGAAFFGVTTPGAESAQKLKALGGWLVANVPRMEGPQSNFDVANYQVQAADVANDQLPVARRLAALTTIKQMMANTVDGGATGDWSEESNQPKPAANLPKPMKGMVRNGYRFKGGDPANQANWEKM